MGADAGADARERMQESGCKRGFKSCDLSEPIRCANLVSALASAPASALASALVHHVICLDQ